MPKRPARRRSAAPVSGAEVIKFIETHCYLAEGDGARPLRLATWQQAEIRKIYDNPAGARRHILSVARKNSKTTLCAALMLNHLCGPSARRNTELYSSALSRDQAALLYAAAAKMVRLNPVLHLLLKYCETLKELWVSELGTKYKALSADASRNQGLNPVFVVHDDLGQIVGPHSDLYESLELATGSQPNPLSIVISTQAASDADLLSVLLDDAAAGHDPRTTCSLYSAGQDLDPFSEEAIRAANPAFDDFMNRDEVLAMAAAARRMPSREADYRRFTLNQRITVAAPFVSPSLWESCRGQVASLAELPALYGGLDLSAVSDLSAFVLVGQKGGKWHTQCRFWLPQDGLRDKAAADHAPYTVWTQQGHLHTTPGRTIDYEFVAHELRDLCRRYNVQQIAYDPWGWSYFRPALLRAGFTENMIEDRFREFAQTTKMMSPAMRNLERLLLNGKLVHDNPVLSMCVANTTTRTDAAGNVAPDKKKSTHRIDGLVALVMALAMAPAQPQPIDVTCLIA